MYLNYNKSNLIVFDELPLLLHDLRWHGSAKIF